MENDEPALENLGIIDGSEDKVVVTQTKQETRQNSFIKYVSISVSLLLLCAISSSMLIYVITGRERNYTIMTFEFSYDYSPFHTNILPVVLIQLAIILFLVFMIITLSKNKDENFLCIFFEETSTYQILMTAFFSCSFVVGDVYRRGMYSIILTISTVGLSGIFSLIIYKKIKDFNNLSRTSLIGHYVFISITLSFQIYVFLYNLILASTYDENSPNEHTDLKINLSIAAHIIYTAISLVFLSVYKDINFPIILEVIEIGYLSTSYNLSLAELVTSIVVIIFVFISLLITILKNRSAVCGIQETDKLLASLEKHHDEMNN